MSSLFPDAFEGAELPPIDGLGYVPAYVSCDEEGGLTADIDAAPWDVTWERRRQLYGQSYGPKRETVAPIPAWGRALADRIFAEGLSPHPFDQMLVNEYEPGQGIALHRDYDPLENEQATRFQKDRMSLPVQNPAKVHDAGCEQT